MDIVHEFSHEHYPRRLYPSSTYAICKSCWFSLLLPNAELTQRMLADLEIEVKHREEDCGYVHLAYRLCVCP